MSARSWAACGFRLRRHRWGGADAERSAVQVAWRLYEWLWLSRKSAVVSVLLVVVAVVWARALGAWQMWALRGVVDWPLLCVGLFVAPDGAWSVAWCSA